MSSLRKLRDGSVRTQWRLIEVSATKDSGCDDSELIPSEHQNFSGCGRARCSQQKEPVVEKRLEPLRRSRVNHQDAILEVLRRDTTSGRDKAEP